jgi:hypothetical protein
MQPRKFGREFKIAAVRLIEDRGVSVAQAARHLSNTDFFNDIAAKQTRPCTRYWESPFWITLP